MKEKAAGQSGIQLSFTPEELELVRARAASVGMKTVPFIKREALTGVVRGFRLTPLTEHACAIGEIAQTIRCILSSPHPDRWLYEHDLECIADQLDELIEIEKDIQMRVRRRMS